MPTSANDTMPSFDRLLVATDFSAASQAACRTAIDTCLALRASLVILHVFRPPEAGDQAPDGQVAGLEGPLSTVAPGSLEELRSQAVQAGVRLRGHSGQRQADRDDS